MLISFVLYYHEREIEGHIQEDSGANVRDGMGVLKNIGVCPEEDFPYTENFRDKPSPKAESDLALYKIGTYHRIQDLSGLKATCSWISCCTWICCTKIFYVRRSEKDWYSSSIRNR